MVHSMNGMHPTARSALLRFTSALNPPELGYREGSLSHRRAIRALQFHLIVGGSMGSLGGSIELVADLVWNSMVSRITLFLAV